MNKLIKKSIIIKNNLKKLIKNRQNILNRTEFALWTV